MKEKAMKKKLKIQYLRTLSQIFFFIFYPGLFALAFAQIGNVVSMIISRSENKELIIVNILLGLILSGLSIIFGRFFCGWMCSFGAMNDLLYYISKKVFKINFKVSENIDRALKLLKYIVLLFIVICFWILGMGFSNEINLWRSFGEIVKIPPMVPTVTIGLGFLIIIIIGSMVIERFFCRYLCPLGAIFTVFSKLKITNIYKERSVCGKCTACTAKCSMGLALYKEDKVNEVDCISCLKCVDTCPKRNVEIGVSKKKFNAVVVTAVFLVIFFALYFIKDSITTKLLKDYSKGQLNNKSNVQKSTNSIISAPSLNIYKDGTYYGSGRGYDSNIEVKVIVKDGKINTVSVVAINDTPSYYKEAVLIIPNEIVQAQSINVDAVAGATQSSMGIIDGAKQALLNAIGGKTNSSDVASSSLRDYTKGDISSSNEVSQSLFLGKEGSATVGSSKATVDVTLSGQMIKNIKVINLISSEPNALKAKTDIVKEILTIQSTDVKPIKGAKNASMAIIEATKNAMNN